MPKSTPSPSIIPTPTDLAWAAGIIDGEGCIMVKLACRKGAPVRHEVMLIVANTNEPMIRKLQAMFGGGFHITKKRPGQNRRCVQWAIYGRRVESVLSQTVQYMVAKQPEALLALEAAASLVPYSSYNANSGQGAPRPSDAVVARRQAIREELQRLKRVEYTFSDFQDFMTTARSADERVLTEAPE